MGEEAPQDPGRLLAMHMVSSAVKEMRKEVPAEKTLHSHSLKHSTAQNAPGSLWNQY